MDLERIFPLVIIAIIWLVSNAIRKISQADQNKPAPAGQKTGLFEILRQNLAALEEKAQGGEALALDEYVQPPPKVKTVEHIPQTLIESEAALPPALTRTGRKKVPVAPLATISRPASHRKKSLNRMNRRKLQNAVIWSEILAPPIALRDQ